MLKKKQVELISTIHALSSKKILLIGDLMLDHYIWGTVDRISPEGPIPVLKVNREEFKLGGAANVAVNVRYLDCEVFPVGILGRENAGNRIMDIFQRHKISTKGIVSDNAFQTIVKQRAITHQQQLLRVDYESSSVHSNKYHDRLLDNVKRLLPETDLLILSDYSKGVLSESLIKESIRLANEAGIPIVCDPGKGVDFSFYKHVTAIKPNRFEAELYTGSRLTDKKTILKAASIISEACQATFLSISLDEDGLLFFEDEESYRFIETSVPEVHDVTGAGDSLISTLSVLLANGVDSEKASFIANIAAGLETTFLGVQPLSWADIMSQLSNDGLNRKITTLENLRTEFQRRGDTPIIFTNGYFDNISAGHLRFLLEIGKIPGQLIVAINSDDSIFQQKGSAPLLKEQDRARLLASIENVHRIIIFSEPDASELIREISPSVVIKGESFRNETIPEQMVIDEVGAKITYIQHFEW